MPRSREQCGRGLHRASIICNLFFKQPTLRPPRVFVSAPGTPSFLVPRAKSEGDGAPSGAASISVHASCDAWRLSARHRGVLLPAPGRAFRRGLSGLVRQPAPGRALARAEPRRRPSPCLRSTGGGAAFRPVMKTSLDDAPRKDRTGMTIVLLGLKSSSMNGLISERGCVSRAAASRWCFPARDLGVQMKFGVIPRPSLASAAGAVLPRHRP